MPCGYLHFLPVACGTWFILTIIFMYVFAVLKKDVEPVFPYISDTGTFAPESCIFGQLLNTGSILMALVIYIQYRAICELQSNSEHSSTVKTLNRTNLVLGWIASFGVSVVANFQETNALAIHLFGAAMAFGLGSVYQLLMWRVCRLVDPKHIHKTVNGFRLALGIISSVGFVGCFAAAGPAMLHFDGTDMTKWTKNNSGYSLHLISSISEWICAGATMIYITIFYYDFKSITMGEPPVYFEKN